MSKYKYSIPQLEAMKSDPWMTKRQRMAFEQFYQDGLPIETIAANLDVSRRTVNYDLAAIRKRHG